MSIITNERDKITAEELAKIQQYVNTKYATLPADRKEYKIDKFVHITVMLHRNPVKVIDDFVSIVNYDDFTEIREKLSSLQDRQVNYLLGILRDLDSRIKALELK